jgi:EAL domain-containing protein (putative c-di-GMP-specific phosphodiesterase class I)
MSSVLLDQILAPGGLRTVFQPIYRVKDGKPRLHGVECLTRGPRNTNAEDAGVMFEYVRRKRQESVVDRACILAALCAAQRLGGSPRLSVNAHASTLARDRAFPAFLAEAARKRGIAPERITLEIVEHGPALDGLSFAGALTEVRALRMRVALDDVGVGSSNLKMMLDCKPDYFKIDRHFVTNVHSDPGKRAMMEAIAHISRSIGGEVVAEGVENNRELETVRAIGVELIQGHLFCAALETDKLLEREPSLRPSPQPEVN